jgi:hypothetical protein
MEFYHRALLNLHHSTNIPQHSATCALDHATGISRGQICDYVVLTRLGFDHRI